MAVLQCAAMGWSRREVLAALAAAGAAPGWSALLSACGGARPAPAVVPREPVAAETVAGLRDQLRQVAADLGRRFRSVAVRAELGRATRAVVEPEERGFDQRGRSSLVLAGFDGAGWFEQATSDSVARWSSGGGGGAEGAGGAADHRASGGGAGGGSSEGRG